MSTPMTFGTGQAPPPADLAFWIAFWLIVLPFRWLLLTPSGNQALDRFHSRRAVARQTDLPDPYKEGHRGLRASTISATVRRSA